MEKDKRLAANIGDACSCPSVYLKGVGEGGAAGAYAPALSKVGGHKWV